jgi:hypothetical protein
VAQSVACADFDAASRRLQAVLCGVAAPPLAPSDASRCGCGAERSCQSGTFPPTCWTVFFVLERGSTRLGCQEFKLNAQGGGRELAVARRRRGGAGGALQADAAVGTRESRGVCEETSQRKEPDEN